MPADRPSSRPVLPAAVSTLVAAVVQGELVDATVIGAHRYALYLSVRGSVLPVVTADAIALPTAVRLGQASGALEWSVTAGDVVRVGAGRVALPDLDVVATRTWRPARVRTADPARTHLEQNCSGGSATGDDSEWLVTGIRAAVLAARCPGGRLEVGAAVAGIVGRGPGLTPSGDDALAGALLVAHALGAGPDLADAVRTRLASTTAVSAALLDAAADGYAARQVVTLVDAAVADDPDAVCRALPAVLAIGHTSGADTVTGIRAALDARHHREKMNGRRAA